MANNASSRFQLPLTLLCRWPVVVDWRGFLVALLGAGVIFLVVEKDPMGLEHVENPGSKLLQLPTALKRRRQFSVNDNAIHGFPTDIFLRHLGEDGGVPGGGLRGHLGGGGKECVDLPWLDHYANPCSFKAATSFTHGELPAVKGARINKWCTIYSSEHTICEEVDFTNGVWHT